MTPRSVRLPLRFEPRRLQADLDALAPGDWVRHFNEGYYDGDWSGVVLRGRGGAGSRLYVDPGAALSFADTGVLDRCPNIRTALAEFKCPLNSVRLLRLGPGSRIREHRDPDFDVEHGDVGIHVPVMTSPLVRFYLNGERVVMHEGECWYLDLTLPHRVENLGETDRIHLVIHCQVDDWFHALVPIDPPDSSRRSSGAPSPAARTGESFERFRRLVLDTPSLQDELRQFTLRESFIAAVVRLGAERGCDFTEDVVSDELDQSRRAWLARWI